MKPDPKVLQRYADAIQKDPAQVLKLLTDLWNHAQAPNEARNVDGWLTKLAGDTWPGALVYWIPAFDDKGKPEVDPKSKEIIVDWWYLDRVGEPLQGVGPDFPSAKPAVIGLIQRWRVENGLDPLDLSKLLGRLDRE